MGSSIHFRLANSNIFPNVLTGKCSNASYGFSNGERGGKVRAGLYLFVFFSPGDLRVLIGDTIYGFM